MARDLGVAEVRGFDGPWIARESFEADPAWLVHLDLAAADGAAMRRAAGLADGEGFDLAVSMETAEHLDAPAAPGFVAALCGLGAEAVLFSAAIPRQGGPGHVHEAWPGVWAALFAAHGFACHDALRPRLWSDPRVEWWYAQNAFLFARGAASARLAAAGFPPADPPPLVHPRRFALSLAAEDELRARLAAAEARLAAAHGA